MKFSLIFILSVLSLAYASRPAPKKFPPNPSDVEYSSVVPPHSPSTAKSSVTNSPIVVTTATSRPDDSHKIFYHSELKRSKTASKFMATVREIPSELYLCSATFIRKDALLTTARCLFDHDIANILIHYNSTNLETDGPRNVRVKQVIFHPDFDMSPVKNDFSIVVLNEPVNSVTPLRLPRRKIGRPGRLGKGFTWRFTPNANKFLIHEVSSKIVSNSKCIMMQKEIIPEELACAQGPKYQFGTLDHGMPYIVKHKKQNYLFGLSFIKNRHTPDKIQKLWKIEPIVSWIQDTLEKVPKNTTPNPSASKNTNMNDDDDDDDDDNDDDDDFDDANNDEIEIDIDDISDELDDDDDDFT